MHVSTTQVLRRFAQKMAAQTKQANPLTALLDSRVLGSLGGAAVGGLGAYGLSRLLQSDEDKENTPWLMPALGALAGGAGGYYAGPHLAALTQALGKKAPAQSISGVDNEEPQIVDGVKNDAMVAAEANNPAAPPKPNAASDYDYRPPGFAAVPPKAPAKPNAASDYDYRPPGFNGK